MKSLSIAEIQKALENTTSYHNFRQELMHLLGKLTEHDEALHKKNLYRASLMRPDNQGNVRMQYVPFRFKASPVEDEFAEFRTLAEKDGDFK